MGKYSKFKGEILAGGADPNIEFAELCKLFGRLGFGVRVRGDHHILTRDGVAEIINLQPKDKKAKPYQESNRSESAMYSPAMVIRHARCSKPCWKNMLMKVLRT